MADLGLWPWEPGFIGPPEREVLSPDEELIAELEAELAEVKKALVRLVECVEDDDSFSPRTSNALTVARSFDH